MNAFDRLNGPIEGLALMNGLLALDANHLVDADARVDQSEVFEKWTAETDVEIAFEPEPRAKPAEKRKEKLPIDGFVGSQAVGD
jgi:hypothetical protein